MKTVKEGAKGSRTFVYVYVTWLSECEEMSWG